MVDSKQLIKGILGGMVGGAVIDLIFITFIGPSALFSLIGITDRFFVFCAHVILGGILGIIFTVLTEKFYYSNILKAGLIYGLLCMEFVGGIPAIFYYSDMLQIKIIISGFIVWTIFGGILSLFLKKN